MNTSFLKDAPFRRKLREAWNKWTQHIKRYADTTHWWVHYVKKQIKLLFPREGAERNSDRRRMEDFFFTVIYDVVREPGQHADKMFKLKSLRLKIARLNHTYRQRVMQNTAGKEWVGGGPPFITPPYKKSEEATEPNDQQDKCWQWTDAGNIRSDNEGPHDTLSEGIPTYWCKGRQFG